MPKRTSIAKAKTLAIKVVAATPVESSFDEVVRLIEQSHRRAYQAVNAELIDLYWRVGECISRRIESDGWGKGTIVALAAFIQRAQPAAVVSRRRICGGCVSSTTPTAAIQNSQHC